MASILDLIQASLREIGVLQAGETASAEDSADALATINRLVDTWATERLQIYSIGRTTWTITATSTYTVGVGGTVNVVRPATANSLDVKFIDTVPNPDAEYPLSSLTDDAYAGLLLKGLTAPWPTSWYYNPTYPLGTLFLWPQPTASNLLGVIYAPAAVSTFATLATVVSLPPGYERMIVKNLAMELAPSYGRQADPLLVRQASDSKAMVQRGNTRLMEMSFPASILGDSTGWYNINEGP